MRKIYKFKILLQDVFSPRQQIFLHMEFQNLLNDMTNALIWKAIMYVLFYIYIFIRNKQHC